MTVQKLTENLRLNFNIIAMHDLGEASAVTNLRMLPWKDNLMRQHGN